MKEEWFKHPTNLVDLLEDSVKKFGKRNYFGTKNPNGDYEWVTYEQVGARVDNLRGGLAKIGLKKGDTVGVIIDNSVEWAVIAFATYGINARFVPMYEKELTKVWQYIVKDSGLRFLFVADNEIYEKIKGFKEEIGTLEKIFLIRGEGESSMAALEKLGEQNPIPSVKPHWSDIAAIIYTSGTTGDPKGVLLSHGNFTSNFLSSYKLFPNFDENDVTFGILPWAHVFGQTSELYLNTYRGMSCGLMDTTLTLMEDIVKVKPTVLMSVPRVFNNIYNGIHLKMKAAGPAVEGAFNKAKETARILREGGTVSEEDKKAMEGMFQNLRGMFGGRLRLSSTGGATMNQEIAQFFIDLGIPTYDGYGMTETSPGITANYPSANKLGTVGRPYENVTVIIDKSLVGEDSQDGEIICYGPGVMQGYHNKPKETAEAMVEDPVLGKGVRTGDRGWIDEEGFLHITGRFKEEYKLENGKYVHPASIEEAIKLSPLIANVMIYGDGKPFNVGLVVPDPVMLPIFANKIGITEKDLSKLVGDPNIQKLLENTIMNQLKDGFGGYEIPKKLVFTAEDFTVENGLLTQTMKLKRRNVLQKYGDKLNALF
ncbi:MAG: AMP-binding protein [Candidatus Lokiarchaeota archaeon]|nr:AMP-binding protein [Candidatus Lokiarchaeota archaeon]